MPTTDPLDDPDLTPLVSQALELRDQGIEPQLELICERRPDLIAAVRDSVRASEMLPMLQHSSATHDSYSGQVLVHRYRLEERLGSGAMGVVYRGHDQELDRAVAVKILRLGLLGGDEAEFRFARESEVLAAIDHPAVVRVYDRGRTDRDDPFLVMELLDGSPLSQILEQGKGDGVTTHSNDTGWVARHLGVSTLDETSYLRAACRWAADLASGLESAHRSEIYHRDIKPSNVVLRRDGRPVLLDFGIAARASQQTYTRAGAPLGTPAYMAPESLSEGHRASPTQDVYGLTATLYHLLTLRAPYSGNPSQVITTLLTKEAPLASSLRPGLPRDLQAILDMGMARDPKDRYASAADLENDLRCFLDYRPVQARHIPGWSRTWRRLRRSSAFRAGAAVAMLAVLVFGAVEVRAAWRVNQQVQRDEVWKHLPVNLTVNSPEFRKINDPARYEEVEDLLDRAVELSVTPLPDRLVRANFRLDHGDPVGAASDLRVIANSEGGSYLAAVADRYAALPETATAHAELDLTALPPLSSAMDHYVAGILAGRSQDWQTAFELLKDPRLERFAPAQEVLYFEPFEFKKLPQQSYEQAVLLEGLLPERTANSAYRVASSLAALGQHDRSIPIFEEGLRLDPGSAHLHENLGRALYRTKQLDRAQHHLELAIELLPGLRKPYENLMLVHVAAGNLEAAQAVADAMPLGTGPKADYTRLSWRGRLEAEQALHHLAQGDLVLAREASTRSCGFFDQGMAISGRPVGSNYRLLAEAILADETEPVFTAMLRIVNKDPLHERVLQLLPQYMPPTLGEEAVELLRGGLEKIAEQVQILESSQEPTSPSLTTDQ